jgi:hypothetical protein
MTTTNHTKPAVNFDEDGFASLMRLTPAPSHRDCAMWGWILARTATAKAYEERIAELEKEQVRHIEILSGEFEKDCDQLRDRAALAEKLRFAREALNGLHDDISEPSWTDSRLGYEERQVGKGAVEKAREILEKLK